MKKFILILLVLLTNPVESKELDSAYIDVVRAALLDSAISERFVDEVLVAFNALMKDKGVEVDVTLNRKKERMLDLANKFFESKEYLEETANIYSKLFTIQEAKELAAFYRTSTGKKYLLTRENFSNELNLLREKLYLEFGEQMSNIYFEGLL